MRKFFVTSFVLIAASAACCHEACAQDSNTTTASTSLEARVDSLAARTAVLADTAATRGIRFGREMAARTAVALDSAAVIGERLGRRSLVMGDSLVQRSKRAWRALKGEDVQPGNDQTADPKQAK